MARSQAERVLALAGKQGLIRPRDLEAHRIPRTTLRRLVERGQLERVGLGLYRLPDADIDERQSLVEATRRVPGGVVCLLSALRFHELTTQSPFEVWLAIPSKAWRPRATTVALRLVHSAEATYSFGIETHRVNGSDVRVYSAAKTVADCFKFRGKVGLDVAIEALRDYRKRHRGGMDALWRAVKVCRVTRVVQPYLEAMG
jgi:predicted transcriptional regulator of viral defense system